MPLSDTGKPAKQDADDAAVGRVAGSSKSAPGTLRQSLWNGLCTAVIVSLLFGALECGVAVWRMRQQPECGPIPFGLVIAALGRNALTHLIIWPPVALLLSAATAALWRRSSRPPEPFVWAFLLAVGGMTVVSGSLSIVGKHSRVLQGGACAGAAAVACIVFLIMAGAHRRFRPKVIRRVRNVAVVACALWIAIAGKGFIRTPLFDPADSAVSTSSRVAPSSDRRNVLVIVLDTVRADHLGMYGQPDDPTPFLDSWADSALVFENAFSNGIWTVPSHASMFTGLSMREHGTDIANQSMHPSNTTLAETLAAAGYETVSFSNNPWVSQITNLSEGFQTSRVMYHLHALSEFSLQRWCEWLGLTPPLPWLDCDYGAAMTNQLIAQWLDQKRDDDRPFLLFVNYMEAHLPYQVPQDYRRQFMSPEQVRRSYALRRSVFGDLVWAMANRYNVSGPSFITESDREVLRRQYLAAIRYLDGRVDELIASLQDRGLLDHTLVIITADHGEYLGGHGFWDHRFLTYNDVCRVPFIVRDPGRAQGLRVNSAVQVSNVFETVLKFALDNDARDARGMTHDLIAIAEDEADGSPPRLAIIEYGGADPVTAGRLERANRPSRDHLAAAQRAVTDGRFKYMVSQDRQRELYDLVVDPQELTNLVGSHPEEVLRLESALTRWLERTPRFDRPADETQPVHSPETLEALRALGYVGGDE